MRRIIIRFEIGDAAFTDDFECVIDSALELAKQRILAGVEKCRAEPPIAPRLTPLGKLADFNGNAVGEVNLID